MIIAETVNTQRDKIFHSLFEGYEGSPFAVRLWDGWLWHSSTRGETSCTIVVHSANALRSLVLHPSEVTLGEAFLTKDIDVEGDLFSVFDVAEHVFHCSKGRQQRLLEAASGILSGIGKWCKTGGRHSQNSDLAAISYHYDQPAAFYKPWLGKSLVYSCAYFQSADDDIDTAQTSKLELICRKLRMRPCERFLDIGCGWGSLILHAASRHNVEAYGITLSREQEAVASARIEAARLTQSCHVELLDYRNAVGRLPVFDKISSVGMVEHVGLQNLPLYFKTAYSLLKPGGVFLNHGIARAYASPGRGLSFLDRAVVPFLRNVLQLSRPHHSSFIDKYVFPNGELVTLSQAARAAEWAGFEVRDVENLREHYDLTLRRWVDGLRRNAGELLNVVSETTYRIWLLYMAGSAAAFRRGDIAVYQMLLSRPDRGNSNLPMTREDWYTNRLSAEAVEV
ncbi:MAG TPA: cyclopropane-fatty-acyl-phospholipid synthase family protein [Acidobacteriaceae bacterium]|nr:cyclopropane-fatty-acyl-phospholipid synthase family protein [Acidobacteriaceae bacterium]